MTHLGIGRLSLFTFSVTKQISCSFWRLLSHKRENGSLQRVNRWPWERAIPIVWRPDKRAGSPEDGKGKSRKTWAKLMELYDFID
jgi:hypothetical protein